MKNDKFNEEDLTESIKKVLNLISTIANENTKEEVKESCKKCDCRDKDSNEEDLTDNDIMSKPEFDSLLDSILDSYLIDRHISYSKDGDKLTTISLDENYSSYYDSLCNDDEEDCEEDCSSKDCSDEKEEESPRYTCHTFCFHTNNEDNYEEEEDEDSDDEEDPMTAFISLAKKFNLNYGFVGEEGERAFVVTADNRFDIEQCDKAYSAYNLAKKRVESVLSSLKEEEKTKKESKKEEVKSEEDNSCYLNLLKSLKDLINSLKED